VETFRPELHIWPLRAFIDEARDTLGNERLSELLSKFSLEQKDFLDTSAWVSLEFVEALLQDFLDTTKDPEFFDRATIRGMASRYVGPLYPLLVALGTPAFTYKQLQNAAGRVNKTGKWFATDARTGFVRMTWAPNPTGPHERKPFICRTRVLQLSRIPLLFGRPAATVSHPQCALRGDSSCVYEVSWPESQRRAPPKAGLLIGLLAGGWLSHAYLSDDWVCVAATLALGLGGWAVGRVWSLRGDLSERSRDIAELSAALERTIQTNEQRYADLLQAKAEVEQRVEQRTADLRLATQQLSETLTQVQELDRAKTNFFSNVSHDLRTPLTLILGPLGEMAQGREPPGGQGQAVDVMQRNGMRLLDLINQILDLAKIDAGKMQLARMPTNLADLARTVERRFSAQAAERKLQLLVVSRAIAPLSLDSGWIEMALTNLVGNAMRFARTKVMLSVREGEGAVLVEVEDDGPGIAAEDIATVFDRFAQGSDMQARKGGTGLGLAIVREAARLHGGDASVRSVPGQATVFTLTLPRTMSAAADGTSVRPGVPPTEDSEARLSTANRLSTIPPIVSNSDRLEWPGPDPSAPLVVVVEDDDDLRAFTAQVLASSYRVRAARNGQEALALIADARPDAVVSDVVMPNMDGYELTRQLRMRDESRTLPIILLTARRDVGRVLEGFEAGADDYLTKPFQARELLARVGVHVRLRRIVSEMAHRERLASLGVLAASLAHQVRNPLNTILAGLPAVQRKLGAALNRRDDEIFVAMIDSGERINTLIKDLMDLSRVDREVTVRFKPADSVRACVRLIEARVQASVIIESELDDGMEIMGKAGDLSHVFLNLIDNAVRAAEPQGRVRLRVERRGDEAIFEVGDSGPGIPAERIEAVFAPFYTTRSAGEGTGLGLAIARQVVIQHGGAISVGRSPLGGALFTVSLPASVAVPPGDPDLATAPTVH
jgi:signal transduction histidine kinase